MKKNKIKIYREKKKIKKKNKRVTKSLQKSFRKTRKKEYGRNCHNVFFQ